MSSTSGWLLNKARELLSITDNYYIDTRQPEIILFTIPSSIVHNITWLLTLLTGGEHDHEQQQQQENVFQVGIANIDSSYWILLQGFALCTILIHLLGAFIIYYGIIQPRKKQQQQRRKRIQIQKQEIQQIQQQQQEKEKNGIANNQHENEQLNLNKEKMKNSTSTTTSFSSDDDDDDDDDANSSSTTTLVSFFITFGFFIPTIIMIPFYLMKTLQIHDGAFGIVAASPIVLVFRCLAAYYGTHPTYCERNIGTLLTYYAVLIPFRYDEKTGTPIPITKLELLDRFLSIISLVLQGTLLFSIMSPNQYTLFRKPIHNIWDYLYWGNIINNYIMASITATCLQLATTVNCFIMSVITGYSSMNTNTNPLTASTSPSNFWGTRWNKWISIVLKASIMKPILKYNYNNNKSKKNKYIVFLAGLAAFIASGIFHEYIITVLIYGDTGRTGLHPWSGRTFHPILMYSGQQLLFFTWNGIMLVCDRLLRNTTIIKYIEHTVPTPIRTILVLMLVLPVAHLFIDEYITLGVYRSISLGFPKLFIIPIHQ